MLSDKINLKEKLSKFTKHWSPRIIAEMNDYQFKIAKIKGEFIWHDHKDTDETFIIIEGTMCIKLRDSIVEFYIHLLRKVYVQLLLAQQTFLLQIILLNYL